MADSPYIGGIKMFGGNFPPAGWAFCDGSVLPISEYETLFMLIGTTYGGDGQSTFALPDLRGRVPVHQGQGPGLPNYVIGEKFGVETVTLTSSQIPAHSHALLASTDAASSASSPAGSVLGKASGSVYGETSTTKQLAATTLAGTGGSQPHENMAPYLGVNFIISLYGVFPSPT